MNKHVYKLALINAKNIATSELFLKTGLNYTKPTQVYAQINDKCNSKCIMCDCWRETKPELTSKQWINGLKKIKSIIGNYKICFTGGEVFVKEDFFEILEFCSKEGILFGITSNGIALNINRIKRLIDLKPFNINFSFDSLDSENYKSIRGVSCFETVKSNIEELMNYKKKVSSNVVVTLKTVVNSKNTNELCKLAEYANQLGVQGITFDKIKKRRKYFIEKFTPEFEELYNLDYPLLKRTITQLIEMKKAGYNILNSEESMRQWAEDNRSSIRTEKCIVPVKNLYIDSQGILKFCENIDIEIANFNDWDLKSIMKSKKTTQIKRDMVNCQQPCDYCVKRSVGDYAKLFFRFMNA